jgi:hypothetical protein
MNALGLLAMKSEWRSGTSRRWLAADHASFRATLPVVLLLHEAQTSLFIEDGSAGSYDPYEEMPLSHHADLFQAALPFDEGERIWLAWLDHNASDVVNEIRWHGRQKRRSHALTAGLWQPAGGQDALDRWWAWRRETYEYEGQNAIKYACRGLRGIGSILVPNMPSPPNYVQMLHEQGRDY